MLTRIVDGPFIFLLTLTQLQRLKRNMPRTEARMAHANVRVLIHTDVFHELSL